MKKRSIWISYVFDFLIIIVGILAAFWLNQWAENRKSEQQFQEKITGIENEIRRNLVKVDEALIYHDSLITLIIETPEDAVLQLRPASVKDYAWQILLNSNLENHLSYDTYELLTEIYDIQLGLQEHNELMLNLIHLSNVAGGFVGSMMERKYDSKKYKQGWISVLEDEIAYEKILSEKYQEALEQLEKPEGE